MCVFSNIIIYFMSANIVMQQIFSGVSGLCEIVLPSCETPESDIDPGESV